MILHEGGVTKMGLFKKWTASKDQEIAAPINPIQTNEMTLNIRCSSTLECPAAYVALRTSKYDIQLLLHPNPKKILIVGSGTGNDVAGAIRHKVQKITAVEIDPAIISMGRRFHPQKPYDSPAVRIINDDARSFFSTSDERFDVISFGGSQASS
jgi:protein-L-isoaspartate O-methyltransferase